MNDECSGEHTIRGRIRRVDLSMPGRRSAELTLAIGTKPTIVYAHIVEGGGGRPYSIEHTVFAGLVSIAAAACGSGTPVECTCVGEDKPHIVALTMG
jgi:hypothetical protein